MADFEKPSDAATITADNAAPVTPSDSVDLDPWPYALMIGGSGDLKVTTRGGGTVTLTAVPAGLLPLRVRRVWATGTTATDISALW